MRDFSEPGIGNERQSMDVSELMAPASVSVKLTTTVTEAAKLMRDTSASCLAVTNGGIIEGVISESDMVIGCMANGHIPWQCTVERHMAPQDQVIASDTQIGDASLMVIDGELEYLPVVDEGKLAGILESVSVFGAIDSEMDNASAWN